MNRFLECLVFYLLLSTFAGAQQADIHRGWPGPGQLFVGTCYQPVDRSPEQIVRDIAIMKHAGFNVVRMGDLSWDSFEPEQGRFEFAWFDKIMDQMQAAGIRVILDIPGSPAQSGCITPGREWMWWRRMALAFLRLSATWTTSATRIMCVN